MEDMQTSYVMNPMESKAYKFSLACGAIPLVLGLIIFITWLELRWKWLEMAGLFTLFVGILLFVCGSVALASFLVKELKSATPRQHIWRSMIFPSALLLINFPVAGAIIHTVIDVETSYYLTIQNHADASLSDIHIFGGGCNLKLRSVPPKTKSITKIYFSKDDSLTLEAKLGSASITNIVEGYVTSGLGGVAIVSVEADGQVTVIHPQ
jgi:hypothetical protein